MRRTRERDADKINEKDKMEGCGYMRKLTKVVKENILIVRF